MTKSPPRLNKRTWWCDAEHFRTQSTYHSRNTNLLVNYTDRLLGHNDVDLLNKLLYKYWEF
jgi:hypothetical protein